MVKYLYLDDAEKNTIAPYIRQVKQADNNIEIELRPPKRFDKQIEEVIADLKSSNYDGLILDLKLDERTNNDERANFRAPAIAQELRSRANDDKKLSHPIILWSTDQKLNNSYYRDSSAQDLFDLVCSKEKIEQKSTEIAGQLISLVNSYEIIQQIIKKKANGSLIPSEERLRRMLGLKKNQSFLDPRILNFFDGIAEDSLEVYKYARFTLKELVETPGPLIDEQVLAARLGIDLVKSSDWEILKNDFLSQFSYKGVFGGGWSRWWGYLLDEWWKKNVKVRSLRELPANERIAKLRNFTKLNDLVSASPIKEGYSKNYWTICQVERTPLAPINGLILKQNNRQPWHEYLYVSEKIYKAGRMGKLEIDSLEKQKLH